MTSAQFEVHDPAILAHARAVLDACQKPGDMQQAVLDAVKRNEDWRGKQCVNLLAPEAPTSHTSARCSASTPGAAVMDGREFPAVAAYAIRYSRTHTTRRIQTVIARSESDETIQLPYPARWIVSRSLSSGAHSRDPVARNGVYTQ